MKKFEYIIASFNPPNENALWLDKGVLKVFFNGAWTPIKAGYDNVGGSGEIDFEALNKEIQDRKDADKALQNSVDELSSDVNSVKTGIQQANNNITSINSSLRGLENNISTINSSKQDKFTTGTGLKLENNVLSVDLDLTLYKVVTSLPTRPATADKNKIFLVQADNTEFQNKYVEYLFNSDENVWEKLGEVTAKIDLEGYVKESDLERELEEALESAIQDLNLSSFETKEHASNTYQPKGDYLTQHQSLDNYYTKLEVDDLIKDVDISDQLEDYAKASDIPSLVGYATESWVLDKNYLTEHQDLSDYVNSTELQEAVKDFVTNEQLQEAIDEIDITDKLEDYVTNEDLQNQLKDKANITDIPSLDGYAKSSEVTAEISGAITNLNISQYETIEGATEKYQPKGTYLTEHQSLDDYYNKAEVDKKVLDAITDGTVDLEGYATEQWVKEQNYLKEHQSLEGLVSNDAFALAMAGKADITSLEEYAKTEDVESLIANVKSEILGGAGEDYDTLKEIEEWVTEHQDLYQGLITTIAGKADADDLDDMATMTWVNNQNYLTEHQDLSSYETTEHAEETYQKKGNYLTEHQSLEEYAKKEELSSKADTEEVEQKIEDLKEEIESTFAKQEGEYPDMTVGNAANLEGTIEIVNDSAYRPTGGTMDVKYSTSQIENIKGQSIAWNQLVQNGNFANGVVNWVKQEPTSSASVSNKVITITNPSGKDAALYYNVVQKNPTEGHVFLSRVSCYRSKANTAYSMNFSSGSAITKNINTWENLYIIAKVSTGNNANVQINLRDGQYKNCMVFNLTLIYGIGNEPTTLEQFEADYQRWFGRTLEYEEYDAGSIRTTLATGIKTVGFNLVNIPDFEGIASDWYKKGIIWKNDCNYDGKLAISFNLLKDSPNDSNQRSTNVGFDVIYKNGTIYPARGNTNNNHYYVANQEVDYIRAGYGYVGEIKISNICINFVHSGIRNGDYEPHWEETKALPITTLTGKLNGEGESIVIFPDGLKRAGTICDEIYEENGVTKAIKRVGSVDLGTLDWIYETADSLIYFRSRIPLKPNNRSSLIILCSKYVSDKSSKQNKIINGFYWRGGYNSVNIIDNDYTDATAFKNSLNGVIAYYELAEPEVYIIDNFQLPAIYKIDDFGTEEIIQPENSIAPIITSRYGINAVDSIRRLPTEYISNKSADEFIRTINSTTNNNITKTWDNEKGCYTFSNEVDEDNKDNSIDEDAVNNLIDNKLDGYATTEWVEQQQYLTEHQDISNLATKDDIKDILSKIEIVDSNSKELGSVIEAGSVYYNNAQDKTISTFTGFDNNNAEAIIISAYPIIFDNSSIRKAQYIDYLITENGTYVYTLKSISATSNYIIVNCTIYEE